MRLSRDETRRIRQRRVRMKVRGVEGRPRLNVFRSSKHMYAQLVDDTSKRTLVAASTLSKELKGALKSTGNKQAAEAVGKLIAEKSLAAGIQQVIFDRNGFLYHGRVRALAEAARGAGLKF
jgi:large subunit ribosomal protein L18